jgi:hypothetical protein
VKVAAYRGAGALARGADALASGRKAPGKIPGD